MADRSASRQGAEGLLVSVLGRERGSLLDMFCARAELHPDATFLSWHDGIHPPRSWTYAEAWTEVRRCAAGWRALGISPGARVASFVWNHPRAVWAWLGATATGATYVPLNRHLRGPLLADQLKRSKAAFVVTELAALPILGALEPTPVLIDDEVPAGRLSFASVSAHEPGPVESLDPGAVGYITFTSGSTGRSKAVRLPNNALLRAACAYACPDLLDLGQGDVLFAWSPLSHLGGLVPLALAGGAECALHPRFSASRFWSQLESCGATYVEGFPVMIDYLLNRPASGSERRHRLRYFFVAGHDRERWRAAERRFGIAISNVAFDMSETGVILANPPAAGAPEGSCGRPAPGWDVTLRDDDGDTVQGPGHGELLVRPTAPDIIFAGYEDDADATVRAWRDLWFATGDLFDRDLDGNYRFRGRAAHRIRRRGENVSEEELNALLKSHPDIAAAAVVAIPSARGEDDIKAALVPGCEPFDLTGYIAWCRTTLPRHMMPRYFETMADLPVTPSQKLDVTLLQEPSPAVVDTESDELTDPRHR